MAQSFDSQQLPRIIFVTGGPGTGKGTQCANLVEQLGYSHVSVGDIMRDEIKSGSVEGLSIQQIVQSGNLVPKELTISLLLKKLQTMDSRIVLIDGFPRSAEQAVYLEQLGLNIDYILHFDTDREDILLDRLLERGRTSGRADDNEETILKRFYVYKSESVPVLALYEPFGYVRRVDCLAGIPEVYQRTLRALRAELFCFIGPMLAGKTTLAMSLLDKLNLNYLSIDDIKTKRRNGVKVTLKDDSEIVNAVVKKLQYLKKEYRVVLEGFPENVNQASLFAQILGQPNKVLYVQCPLDYGLQRLQGQVTSQEYSNLYHQFTQKIGPLIQYYQDKLGSSFGQVEGFSDVEGRAENQARKIICPEVINIRGHLKPAFLQWVKQKGYNLVNVEQLLKLYIDGRGKIDKDVEDYSDDFENLSILKEKIFSGNGVQGFALYNFSLGQSNLYSKFEQFICKINRNYYLHESQCRSNPDPVTLRLYGQQRLNFLENDKLGQNLDEETSQFIDEAVKNCEKQQKGSVIQIIGPLQSGKTEIFDYLIQNYGYTAVDLNDLMEEHKNRLSTEDEPKESLTFTECCEGITAYLTEHPDQTIVFDGLPIPEVMTLPDDLFPEVEFQGEEGGSIEEDPFTDIKLQKTVERFNYFLKNIPLLSIIDLRAERSILEQRLWKKAELGEDDEELPLEMQQELTESILLYERLRGKADNVQNQIPCRFILNSANTKDYNKKLIDKHFAKKLILVQSEYDEIKQLLIRHSYNNFVYFVDYLNYVDQLLQNQDPLLSGNVDYNSQEIKEKILQKIAEGMPRRTLLTIIYNYSFTQYDNYSSTINQIIYFEQLFGQVNGFITFAQEIESHEVESLPVQERRVQNVKKEEDEDEEEEKQVEIVQEYERPM